MSLRNRTNTSCCAVQVVGAGAGWKRDCRPVIISATPCWKVGGSVVAGELGGHGAYPGEFAAGEAVQAEPEQVVGLVGVVDDFL